MKGLCSQPDVDENELVCGHPLPCPRHPEYLPCPRCHRNDEHPDDWRTITLGARYDLAELDVPFDSVMDVESIADDRFQGRVYNVRVCKRCRDDLLSRVNEWWRNCC